MIKRIGLIATIIIVGLIIYNLLSQILEALNNLGSFDSCDQAASTANSTGQQIIDQNNAINNDFDNATHHGMTTGAVFP